MRCGGDSRPDRDQPSASRWMTRHAAELPMAATRLGWSPLESTTSLDRRRRAARRHPRGLPCPGPAGRAAAHGPAGLVDAVRSIAASHSGLRVFDAEHQAPSAARMPSQRSEDDVGLPSAIEAERRPASESRPSLGRARSVSMKGGPAVKWTGSPGDRARGPVSGAVGLLSGSSSAHLSMALCERDKVSWEAAPAAQFHRGSSSDQTDHGACRMEGFVLREDVPDGLG
jgi:hypothetical protein